MTEVLQNRADLAAYVKEDRPVSRLHGLEPVPVTGGEEGTEEPGRRDHRLLCAVVVREGHAVNARGQAAAHMGEIVVSDKVSQAMDLGGVVDQVHEHLLEGTKGSQKLEQLPEAAEGVVGLALLGNALASQIHVGSRLWRGWWKLVRIQTAPVFEGPLHGVAPDAEDAVLPADPPLIRRERVVPAVRVIVLGWRRLGHLKTAQVAEVMTAGLYQVDQLTAMLVQARGNRRDAHRDDVRGLVAQRRQDPFPRQHTAVAPHLFPR